jgi:AraC family transcriptional regulator
MAVGSAPGESGVSVFSLRFRGGLHFSATTQQHLIWFGSPVRIDCRIADRTLRQRRRQGRWRSVLPVSTAAPMPKKASTPLSSRSIPASSRSRLRKGSALDAQLKERLSGYDQTLVDIARTLALESAKDYPDGAVYWNEVAGSFIHSLLARHTSGFESRARGMLGKDVLERLKDYVVAHLDEPIEVAELAKITARRHTSTSLTMSDPLIGTLTTFPSSTKAQSNERLRLSDRVPRGFFDLVAT